MPDTTWNLTDGTQTTTVDGAEGESLPDIVVGSEVTFTFFTQPQSEHSAAYSHLTTYSEFLSDGLTDFGLDYNNSPWYRYSVHPDTPVNSYLFKVEPSTDVTGAFPFWGLLVACNEQSHLSGEGGRIEMRFFVLAHTADYSTRSAVQTAFRGDL